MSEFRNGDVVYRLLVIVNFVLFIIFSIFHYLYISLEFTVQLVLDGIMTETNVKQNKKRKRNTLETNEQAILNRNIISGNWQKLLSSNLMEKMELPVQQNNNFTGTFRRARKKKAVDSKPIQDNLKSLNLSESLVKNDTVTLNNLGVVRKQNGEIKNNDKKNKMTKYIAMDCEMVGIGADGSEHMLARVSLVNKFGDCIYDKFVKPREEVVDYRTEISGIRKEDMLNGEDFTVVQKEVAEILRGKVLVGHSLRNDMAVLFLSHPKRHIRDTSKYKPFKKITKGSTPSLKRLAKEILGVDIQHGEHSSIEDAQATMQLYCTVANAWETSLKRRYKGIVS